jgi:demethylmenaquinone methyltransferase/2-methoxy-6-polyprenyl-1,4-benzoquinol methylase
MKSATGKQEFFNKLAEKWDESPRHDLIKIEVMLELLGIKQGDKVLDVGTGTGVLVPLLSRFTGEADITAIDFAENMITAAKKKFPGSAVTFISGDVLEYPFEIESFDFVVCYSVFPHLDNHAKALRRLAVLLKPGGVIAIMHSAGREAINMGHGHVQLLKQDMLPPYDIIRAYMRTCGLQEEVMIDNKRMYMVCGRRV